MSGAREKLRVLVANRGEIAARILRTLRTLGIPSVAVYSDADRDAPYLHRADRAVPIGGTSPAESYLDIEKLLAAGRRAGANAVHPGYGFLSENPRFAAAVEGAGWTFIGPTAESMERMGDKVQARRTAEGARVPVVPSHVPAPSATAAEMAAALGGGGGARLELPLIIKAAAGGGGKGMRVVRERGELAAQIESAMREAEKAFGDPRVFFERFLEGARHVEVQVLGDGRGKALALGERDCSIQRRHQKLIEESPAPGLEARRREELHAAAVALAESVRYRGAGTMEFLLAPGGEFYFLEMNTRLQVEHPVTELVHGLDLVAAQIDIACGAALPNAHTHAPRGHAIEVRVCAENPAGDFLPSTGTLLAACFPSGPGIRVDAGVESGSVVSPHYDSLLAKIIAHGEDRAQALRRLVHALGETFISGVHTTAPFLRDVLLSTAFREARLHTGFIAHEFPAWRPAGDDDPWLRAALAAAPALVGRAGAHGELSGARAPGVWDTLARGGFSP